MLATRLQRRGCIFKRPSFKDRLRRLGLVDFWRATWPAVTSSRMSCQDDSRCDQRIASVTSLIDKANKAA
jgi:hypothetical protein